MNQFKRFFVCNSSCIHELFFGEKEKLEKLEIKEIKIKKFSK